MAPGLADLFHYFFIICNDPPIGNGLSGFVATGFIVTGFIVTGFVVIDERPVPSIHPRTVTPR
ncbi:MAG: hypothetical protein ACHWZW_10680 [Spirulina sp.]